jgi:ribonuclease M5
VGVGCENSVNTVAKNVTVADLYDDGLSGKSDSAVMRKRLLKYLDLPERMSAKSMLEIINIFMTYDEYKDAVNACTEALV